MKHQNCFVEVIFLMQVHTSTKYSITYAIFIVKISPPYLPSLLAEDDGLGLVWGPVTRFGVLGVLHRSMLLLTLALLLHSSSWLTFVLFLLPSFPPHTPLCWFLASLMCIGLHASMSVFLCGCVVCKRRFSVVMEEDWTCFKSEPVFSDILTANHADQVNNAALLSF